MALEALKSWDQVDRLIEETCAMSSEEERIRILCDHYYQDSTFADSGTDPCSPAFLAQILEFYKQVSGRTEYMPAVAEQSPFVEAQDIFRTAAPYNFKSSAFIGEFLITYGFILRCLALHEGARVLEYGCGSGQILLHLARMGCQVTAVDIEPKYLDLIQQQADAMGVEIQTLQGTFGEVPPGARPYDVVLFFESFHHCLHHGEVMRRLHDIVADDGRIAFAGEPIIEPGNYWRPTIPYAWGPRLDMLSIRAMKAYGWLELGFQQEYFVRLLLQSGWLVRRENCSLTSRADTWIARKQQGLVLPGATDLPADEAATWHAAESDHVWTTKRSVMTLDERPIWKYVSVEGIHFFPMVKTVTVQVGNLEQTIDVAANEEFKVRFDLANCSGKRRLVISCEETIPANVSGSLDNRGLGVALRRIVYT